MTQMREVGSSGAPGASRSRGPVRLGSVQAPELARMSMGFPELDRVLGGGAVRGGAYLLGGDPGIGKSTLLLQALSNVAGAGERVLYVSGEESEEQIAARGERLAVSPEILLFGENDVDTILEIVEHARPVCLVVDSAQTLRTAGIEGVAGGVVQVRHATSLLVEQCKRLKSTLLLVCHITKGGEFAGPKTLEHLVDGVLSFEMGTFDRRLLTCSKNRFGSTAEVGLFEMSEDGLKGVMLSS